MAKAQKYAACSLLKTLIYHNRSVLKLKIDTMDLDALYALCKAHSISALVSSVLLEHIKENREQYTKWSEEQMKALYRDMNFATERAKILAFLEENGIWYMPMKGIVLKDYYPQPELREFADNDILFDEAAAENRVAVVKSFTEDEHVKSVRLLGVGEVPFAQNFGTLTVKLPAEMPTPYVNVLAVELA